MEASVLAELKVELVRLAERASRPGHSQLDKLLYQSLLERVLAESRAGSYLRVSGAAAGNAAIVACAAAYNEVYLEFVESDCGEPQARQKARAVWHAALPPLTTSDNIRDFVACVAYGLATEMVGEQKAARMLYAAQVAQSNLKIQSAAAALEEKNKRRGPYNTRSKSQNEIPVSDVQS